MAGAEGSTKLVKERRLNRSVWFVSEALKGKKSPGRKPAGGTIRFRVKGAQFSKDDSSKSTP